MMRNLALFLFVFGVLFPLSGAAQGRPVIHVEIVLDSSGSMRTNDVRKLSTLAGMIFTDLIGPNDRLGIVSMKKGAFRRMPLTRVSGARDDVRQAVYGIPFQGGTFCGGPLNTAGDSLKKAKKIEPDAQQFVVFLSDGACPTENGADAELRDATEKLRQQGVKIFSVGLFGGSAKPEWEQGLQQMATVSNGEYFKVTEANQLPPTFANILGRIIGAQAIPISISGNAIDVQVDGFVYDATVVLTSNGSPTLIKEFRSPKENVVTVPNAQVPLMYAANSTFASMQQNGRKRFYAIGRLDDPESGKWTVKTSGPGNVKGLLLQNYALDPILEVPPQVRAGEVAIPKVWLRDRTGKTLQDVRFLERVDVSLEVTAPSGGKKTLTLKHDKSGIFSASQTVSEAGIYTYKGRVKLKSGGLDKVVGPATLNSTQLIFSLTDPTQTIDLGKLKAGESSDPQTIGINVESGVGTYVAIMGTESLAGLTLQTTEVEFDGSTTIDVTLNSSVEHPGGPIDGHITITVGSRAVKVPVRAEIVPLTFWEKWGRTLVGIGLGLLLLILFGFVVHGIISPFSFPSDARLNWGESIERLNKNEIMIREIPGTGKGFYKNAKLIVGGTSSFLPADGVVLCTLEATGGSQISIIKDGGVEVLKVNKFDQKKTQPIAGDQAGMHTGELYKVGKFYLRIR